MSKGASNTLAPLIDRIISNPLTFVQARQPEKETSDKSAGYIVLSKTKALKKKSVDQVQENQIVNQRQEQDMKKQPRSMYEAVQAYTGKKFLTKAEKRAEKKNKQIRPELDEVEDVGEELGEDVGEDVEGSNSEYESASEFPESPEQPAGASESESSELQESSTSTSSSSNEATPAAEASHVERDDEDDEDDEDFDNDVSSEEISGDDLDEDEDEDEEVDDEADADTSESESAEKSPSPVVGHAPKKIEVPRDATTPPTSPEDQDQSSEKILPALSQESESLEDFYGINENSNDRGSNGSTRIYKSWRELSNRKPVGLLNHGVTCYMNSAIQAMLHIPAMQHYLDDIHNGKYKKVLKPRSVSHVLSELSRRMWGLEDGSGNSSSPNKKSGAAPKFINPKKIIQRLGDINCMMSEWQQEDSHEYYMSLMSRLQEDSTPSGAKLNSSILYDIFGGLLHQSVTCKNCGSISNTKQEFYDLSLGLNKKRNNSSSSETQTTATQSKPELQAQNTNSAYPASDKLTVDNNINTKVSDYNSSNNNNNTNINNNNNNANANTNTNTNTNNNSTNSGTNHALQKYSIEKSIKDFFSSELIKIDKSDPSSGYVCENCKQRTNAVKISTIDRAPETLTVHLKRFKFNGNSSSKMKQPVSYPKYLDLSQFSTSLSPTKYQLTSVIVHEGRSISSGHYVAHCLQPDGSWANYDDEYINKINEREALKDPSAYFLVYTRLTHKSAVKRKNEQAVGANKRQRK
ncbi:hypothetical protein CLIB1423_15S00474 [[Candida] railenensis]|uniref:ubiquitinyl hydrolase 1 n=1 Tax=[Candida] railenensis TaxID=45579 RepID=A0A9P0QTA6_9ASCO|nr:hypothetical protein CLIB1423_15S00474 [[Candida] railenensis]